MHGLIPNGDVKEPHEIPRRCAHRSSSPVQPRGWLRVALYEVRSSNHEPSKGYNLGRDRLSASGKVADYDESETPRKGNGVTEQSYPTHNASVAVPAVADRRDVHRLLFLSLITTKLLHRQTKKGDVSLDEDSVTLAYIFAQENKIEEYCSKGRLYAILITIYVCFGLRVTNPAHFSSLSFSVLSISVSLNSSVSEFSNLSC
jgi:hypothetical protein